jgi:VWFA-related protein
LTREVVLDVVVTDRKGNFVNGLTQNDFTILEDKVNQKITSFQPPSAHMRSPDAPAVNSSADLGKIGNAPVTILVLDELNTQFADMVYARGSMEKWLSQQPAKLTQPTALMVASDEKFAVIHDYTQNRDELLVALKKYFPSYPFRMSKGGSVGPDAGTRMAMSLGTLVQIAQASTGTPGRKNVIWVGVGFPSLTLDDVSGAKEAEITAAWRMRL